MLVNSGIERPPCGSDSSAGRPVKPEPAWAE